MDFGMFTEFHVRDGKTQHDAIVEHLDEVVYAEELGLDSVWMAEYHFAPQRSVLSSPFSIGSAIAARTEKIRIGGSVFVVPLINPLRLAEDAAILDHISNGRFEFGIGRSGLTMFYEGFSMDYAESRDRFFEGLEIVLKAWGSETFSHHGQYWDFDDVTIVPKPYQQPHPPIRAAVVSPETFALYGKMGYNISFFAADLVANLKKSLQEYRTAWKEAGHPGEGDANVRLPVYVAETAEQARSEPENSFRHQQAYDNRVTARFAPNNRFAEIIREMASQTYDNALSTMLMYGTPEAVTERIQEYEEETGISGLIMEFNHGGQIPFDRVKNSMRLFAEKVIPNFK